MGLGYLATGTCWKLRVFSVICFAWAARRACSFSAGMERARLFFFLPIVFVGVLDRGDLGVVEEFFLRLAGVAGDGFAPRLAFDGQAADGIDGLVVGRLESVYRQLIEVLVAEA